MASQEVHKHFNGHLLLYTISHVEPLGNAPVRPGYNELTLQLATAACHVQRPLNCNSLTKRGIRWLFWNLDPPLVLNTGFKIV
jgi:hypothetical protein